MNIKRKLERKKELKKRKESEKNMQEKVALFGLISEHCLACQKPFDKNNKEMVLSWNVVVYNEKEVVKLYCPECWDMAQKIIEEMVNDKNSEL